MADPKLKGGLGNALSSALWAALVFMVLPISLVLFTIGLVDVAVADLGTDLPDALADLVDYMVSDLEEFVFNVVVYAIPIVVVALPFGFFKRGGFLRLLFGLVQVVTIALWLYFITNGGVLLVNISDISLPMLPEDLPVDVAVNGLLELDLSGLIYIFMALALAKGAVHLAEYGGYRGRFLRDKHGEDDDDRPVRKEKKSRKANDEDWEYL